MDKFRAVIVRQRWEKTERLMRELKTKLQKCTGWSYVIVLHASQTWPLLFKIFRRPLGLLLKKKKNLISRNVVKAWDSNGLASLFIPLGTHPFPPV